MSASVAAAPPGEFTRRFKGWDLEKGVSVSLVTRGLTLLACDDPYRGWKYPAQFHGFTMGNQQRYRHYQQHSALGADILFAACGDLHQEGTLLGEFLTGHTQWKGGFPEVDIHL